VEIICAEIGTVGNGLTAATWMAVTLPLLVTSVMLTAPTAGGTEQEGDLEYLSRLSRELQLRAKSTITMLDLEIVALDVPGVTAAWATAVTGKPRTITVYLKGDGGKATSVATKTAVEALYAETRMVNTTITCADPSYDKINVTYRAMALPGVVPSMLLAACNSALETALSPGPWGTPPSGQVAWNWVNQPIVHVNKLIQVLSIVPGVDYVESLKLSSAAGEVPGDLTMPGTAPLPEPGTMTGTIDTPAV
jgi:hypothetical protein